MEDSKTEHRISALEAATEYYSELVTVLDTATNLWARVSNAEAAVLNHEGTLEYNPATEFDTTPLNESITRLSTNENEQGGVNSQGRKLVPNQEQVLNSLRSQRDIYEQHITAQQTYVDTATTIEAGIRAYEKSRFDAARSKLTDTRNLLTAGMPSAKYHPYRLHQTGLSLEQYASLLTLRREGVKKLLNVCEPSLPAQQRRSASNEALDIFFEARQVVRGS